MNQESRAIEVDEAARSAPRRPAGDSPILDWVSPAPPLDALVPSGEREIRFASGRRVVIGMDGADRLTVKGPDGAVEIAIRFTAEGPVLCLSSAAIDLAAAGDLTLDCERLRVRARQGIEMETGGDLEQRIQGRHVVEAGGASELRAHKVAIASRLGDVVVKANDDVRIDGERVMLNS